MTDSQGRGLYFSSIRTTSSGLTVYKGSAVICALRSVGKPTASLPAKSRDRHSPGARQIFAQKPSRWSRPQSGCLSIACTKEHPLGRVAATSRLAGQAAARAPRCSDVVTYRQVAATRQCDLPTPRNHDAHPHSPGWSVGTLGARPWLQWGSGQVQCLVRHLDRHRKLLCLGRAPVLRLPLRGSRRG
jgi:hypothetical protein